MTCLLACANRLLIRSTRATGSLSAGTARKVAVLDLRAPHAWGPEDVYTQLVYSARAEDVFTVLVGGEMLVDEGELTRMDDLEPLAEATHQRARALQRSGIQTD